MRSRRQLAGHHGRFGDNQVGKVVAVRDLVQGPLLDAYPAAVKAGRVEGLSGGGHLGPIGRNRVDHQLRPLGQLQGKLARFAAQHQAVAPLDPRLGEDRLGGLAERGGVWRAGVGIFGNRLGDRAVPRGPLGTEAVDHALVGAGHQPASGGGQALDRALDLGAKDLLARGGLHADHFALAAGHQQVAGQDQRIVALAGRLPASGRGHLGLGLLVLLAQRGGPVLLGEVPVCLGHEVRHAGRPGVGQLALLGLELVEFGKGGLALLGQSRDLGSNLLNSAGGLLDGVLERLLLAARGGQRPAGLGALRAGGVQLAAGRRIGLPVQGHELRAVGQVGGRPGHHDPPSRKRGEPVTRVLVEGDHLLGARVDVLAGQQGVGPADRLAEVGEVLEPAIGAAEGRRGDPSHGGVERGLGGQQVSLGRDAALRLFAAGVVAPELLAGGGVDGVEEDALGREDAGGQVGHAPVDQDAAPQGPERDHPAVPQHAAVLRRGVEPPDDRPVLRVQAPRPAVVASHVDTAAGHGRRQADRAAGDRRPADAARLQIDAGDLVVGRRAEVDRPAGDHGLEHVVEVYPPQFQNPLDRIGLGISPAGLRTEKRLQCPALCKRRIELLGRDAAAGDVVAIRRPVVRPGGRAHGDCHQSRQPDEAGQAQRLCHGWVERKPLRDGCHGRNLLRCGEKAGSSGETKGGDAHGGLYSRRPRGATPARPTAGFRRRPNDDA